MGSAESQPVRNMDKRTARREYRDQFDGACQQYRQQHQDLIASSADADAVLGTLENDDAGSRIRVFARKRPIFKREIDDGEFDCATCLTNGVITVHDARMRNDMIHQFMRHNEFKFYHAFSELDSNETVYRMAASPLTRLAALQGGHATCMVYGQTGSGKTFTMTSVYQQACAELFEVLRQEALLPPMPDDAESGTCEGGQQDEWATVSLSFIEVAGDDCRDLLREFAPVQLAPGADDSFHPYPVVEPVVRTAQEAFNLIMYGCGTRATAATGVHDASSRSHAVLRLYVRRHKRSRGRQQGSTVLHEGVLTLVDLAGSEHRIDSMYHSAARRKECAQINASLMALKECIRAHGSGNGANIGHIFRKSTLTKVLKGSFILSNAQTHVIATVSPASKDTEHSLNTLRHACIMMNSDANGKAGGKGQGEAEETRFITGGRVYEVEVGSVNVAGISKRNREMRKKGAGVPELKTSNGNKVPAGGARGGRGGGGGGGTFGSAVGESGGDGDNGTATAQKMAADDLTEKEKRRMLRAAERKAYSKLPRPCRQLLEEAREAMTTESYARQAERWRGFDGGAAAAAAEMEQQAAILAQRAAAQVQAEKERARAAGEQSDDDYDDEDGGYDAGGGGDRNRNTQQQQQRQLKQKAQRSAEGGNGAAPRKWMYGGMSAGPDGARQQPNYAANDEPPKKNTSSRQPSRRPQPRQSSSSDGGGAEHGGDDDGHGDGLNSNDAASALRNIRRQRQAEADPPADPRVQSQEAREEAERKREAEAEAAEAYEFILRQREARQAAAREKSLAKQARHQRAGGQVPVQQPQQHQQHGHDGGLEYEDVGVGDCDSPPRRGAGARQTDSGGSGGKHQQLTPSKDRPSVQSLYSTVYAESTKSVPASVLRRQLVTLMRLHGYSDREIDDVAPPSPTTLVLGKEDVSFSSGAEDEGPPQAGRGAREGRKPRNMDSNADGDDSAAAASANVAGGAAPLGARARAQQRREQEEQQQEAAPPRRAAVVHSPPGTRPSSSSGAGPGVQQQQALMRSSSAAGLKTPTQEGRNARFGGGDEAEVGGHSGGKRDNTAPAIKLRQRSAEKRRLQLEQEKAEALREKQRQKEAAAEALRVQQAEAADSYKLKLRQREERSAAAKAKLEQKERERIQRRDALAQQQQEQREQEQREQQRRQQQLMQQQQRSPGSARAEEADWAAEVTAQGQNRQGSPPVPALAKRAAGGGSGGGGVIIGRRQLSQQPSATSPQSARRGYADSSANIGGVEAEVSALQQQLGALHANDTSRYALQRQLKLKQTELQRERGGGGGGGGRFDAQQEQEQEEEQLYQPSQPRQQQQQQQQQHGQASASSSPDQPQPQPQAALTQKERDKQQLALWRAKQKQKQEALLARQQQNQQSQPREQDQDPYHSQNQGQGQGQGHGQGQEQQYDQYSSQGRQQQQQQQQQQQRPLSHYINDNNGSDSGGGAGGQAYVDPSVRQRAMAVAQQRYQSMGGGGGGGRYEKKPGWNGDFATAPAQEADAGAFGTPGGGGEEAEGPSDPFEHARRRVDPRKAQADAAAAAAEYHENRRARASRNQRAAGASAAPFACDYTWNKEPGDGAAVV